MWCACTASVDWGTWQTLEAIKWVLIVVARCMHNITPPASNSYVFTSSDRMESITVVQGMYGVGL